MLSIYFFKKKNSCSHVLVQWMWKHFQSLLPFNIFNIHVWIAGMIPYWVQIYYVLAATGEWMLYIYICFLTKCEVVLHPPDSQKPQQLTLKEWCGQAPTTTMQKLTNISKGSPDSQIWPYVVKTYVYIHMRFGTGMHRRVQVDRLETVMLNHAYP